MSARSWWEVRLANESHQKTILEHITGVSPRRDKYLAAFFHRAGYSDDFRIPFNVFVNGEFIMDCLPKIEARDMVWLSNQIGSRINDMHRRGENCMDNFRLCEASVFGQKPSAHFVLAEQNGCCGNFSERLHNPLTGKTFWFGFNYGH